MLDTIEPEGVNSVTENGEVWHEVKFAVDSGATETVVSEEMLAFVKTFEGAAAKRGVMYEVANGLRIPNLGEKEFVGVTEEGLSRKLKAQVADVNKPLLSVKKVVSAGNRVVFDEDGCYVESKITGERMWMKEEGGMYVLSLWVKDAGF